jgi:transcriptional regulator EpsA
MINAHPELGRVKMKQMIDEVAEMGSSSTAARWSFQRADALLALLQEALSARSQADWSRWLQGDIQQYLPHDILIAAWGDFRSGMVGYDVITQSPELLEHALPKDIIEPLMETVFDHWLAGGQEPLAIDTRLLRSVGSGLFSKSPYALVHGVQDHRSRYDCIYIFIGPDELASPSCAQLCRMALPFIDTGFRQLADRGRRLAPAAIPEAGIASCFSDGPVARPASPDSIPAPAAVVDDSWDDFAAGDRGSPLSDREMEVMQWVKMGKTNSEIAMILNLSTFTVKNHMRRIYKKLDVLNRAQAVGSLDSMQRAAAPKASERPTAGGAVRVEHPAARSTERPKMASFSRSDDARRTPHAQ